MKGLGTLQGLGPKVRSMLLDLGRSVRNDAQREFTDFARQELRRVPPETGTAARGLHGGVGAPNYVLPPTATTDRLDVPTYVGWRAASEDGYDYAPKLERKYSVFDRAFRRFRQGASRFLGDALRRAAGALR